MYKLHFDNFLINEHDDDDVQDRGTSSLFAFVPAVCKYIVTLKPGLGVTQDHQNRHVLIRHL